MKILSLIKRATGSTVKLDDNVYKFLPENDHVADVENEAHIEILLANDAFEAADGTPKKTRKKQEEPKKAEIVLKGLDFKPDSFEYGDGKTILIGDLVKVAFEASELSIEEWNELDQEFIEGKLEIALEELEGSEVKEPVKSSEDTPAGKAEIANKQPKAVKKAKLAAEKASLGQR